MSEFNVLKRNLPIPFNIEFDSTGGSQCQSITVNVGDSYGELPEPTRQHYKFTGWHLDSSSGELVTSSTIVDYCKRMLYASWEAALEINWDGTTNGGSAVTTTNEYFVGDPFGELPASPTKAGYTFIGWFTTATGKTFITEQTTVDSSHTHLYARYMDFQNSTQFQIQPTSTSYRKAGIYSATRRSSSDVIAVDWGDGKTTCVDGNISQIVHEYASTGTYIVKVSDNISDMRISYNSPTWYQTTTSLRYNFKKMLAWSTNVTTLLDRAFYYCYNMNQFVFPTGITSIPIQLFYYCYNLQNIDIPSTVTSFQNYAFQGCYNLKSIVIPTGVSNLASYTFAGCYNLTSITCQRMTAPTANYGTFGYSTYSPYYYVGYRTRSTGNNTLSILPNATGYDTGYWSSPLRNTSYCGFNVKYIGDPCYVTFDATPGSFENGVSSKTVEYMQNVAYGSLPVPIAPSSTQYFSGWFDDPTAGNKITNTSIVPETNALTLYARYTDATEIISFASPGADELDRFYCTVDSMTLPQKSFTLWAKLDGPMVSPNEIHALFKLGDWSSGIGLMMNDASTSNCDVLFEGVVWGTNITVENPTNWHHYAVVFGTSDIKLYVDGELKTTMTNSYITPQSDFGICGYGKPSSEYGHSYKRTMNGKVCRMAIFNKELSQDEVAADMQLQSQSPNPSDLLHLWTNSVNDDIGTWNLTIGGNAYISNETPWS